MKLDWRLLLVLVLSLGLFVGCEDDTDDPEDEATAYEILSEYMLSEGMDVTDMVADWKISDGALVGNEANYFIVDIRAEGAYNAGHVPGAVNSTMGDVLTTVETGNTSNLPVVVVCYSGQSAGHAVMALKLSGVAETAHVLLFGMSSWGPSYDDPWEGNKGDAAIGHASWVTTASPTLPSGNVDPVIVSEYTDGAAILMERVEGILGSENGFGANAVANSAIFDNPANYQILNYWGTSDDKLVAEGLEANPYLYYGHFDGAYQVPPGTFGLAAGMDLLDPAMENVIYCWTGQTSSITTAWLNVVGFDALTLKFGVNALIHSNLLSHKWAPRDADKAVE